MTLITLQELAKHVVKEDCWLAIHGQVYNLTSFLTEHPGGAKVLLREAGIDATAAYDRIHSKDIIANYLPAGLCVGSLEASTAAAAAVATTNATAANATTTTTTTTAAAQLSATPPLSSILNLYDMAAVARYCALSPEAWAYYSSGAEDELTLQENKSAFHRIWLKPRILRNVKIVNTESILFGSRSRLPFYITATALGKLGHPEGEVVLTRAAASRGIVQMIPTLASCSLDELVDAATNNQTQWFQLYVNSNRSLTEKIVRHAEKRGVKALCITVDAPCLGKREKDMRLKFVNDAPDAHHDKQGIERNQGAAKAISSFIDPSLEWSDLSWFKSITRLPLVLKGVQCVEDALLAAQHGVQGIILSNHGGRQLDTVRSGIEILPEVVAALIKYGYRSKMHVFVDGGVSRGSDIFKALALGADAVGLGRAFLYGMSSYGQAGVEKVIDILQEELVMAMRMMGVVSIDELKRQGPGLVITKSLSQHSGSAPRDHLADQVYERLALTKSLSNL